MTTNPATALRVPTIKHLYRISNKAWAVLEMYRGNNTHKECCNKIGSRFSTDKASLVYCGVIKPD